MQLPQADRLDAEPAPAGVRLLDQIFRPPQRDPLVGAGAREAGLGGDENRSVGMQRLADQFLGDVGAVGIGGVDEIDAESPAAASSARRHFGAIVRLAPDAPSGDPHRADSRADAPAISPPILNTPDAVALVMFEAPR